jgi:hypothetical protein
MPPVLVREWLSAGEAVGTSSSPTAGREPARQHGSRADCHRSRFGASMGSRSSLEDIHTAVAVRRSGGLR